MHGFTKNAKKYDRLGKQPVMKAKKRGSIWKCGVQVPRDHVEAIELDSKNGDKKWGDTESLEVNQPK